MPPPKLLVFLTLLSFLLSLQTRFRLPVSKLRTAQSVPRQSGTPSISFVGGMWEDCGMAKADQLSQDASERRKAKYPA
jgi:hypothetical protein